MTLLRLFYAIAFPLLIGIIPISWLFPRREDAPFYLRYALGWGIGTMLLTLSMTLVSYLGFHFSVLGISVLWLPLVALGCLLFVIKKVVIFDFKGTLGTWAALVGLIRTKGRGAAFEKLFAALLSLKVIYVLYEALIKPVTAWDAWAYWILMAKIFFYERMATPVLAALARQEGQPWHMPLLNTWVFLNLGQFNDVLSEIIYPLYFISLLLIFYAALRMRSNRLTSLFFTYLAASIPFYLYHATISYADSIVSFYACASFALFYCYLKDRKESYFIISALFVIFSFLVKRQGYLYFVAWALVALAYAFFKKPNFFGMDAKRYMRVLFAAVFLGAMAVFSLIVVLLRRGDISLIPHLERAPVILSIFINKLFLMGNWNITWFVFGLMLVLLFGRIIRTDAVYLFAISILNLVMLVLFYFYGGESLFNFLLDGTVLNRYLVQFTPFLIINIAAAWGLLTLENQEQKLKIKSRPK